MSARKAAPVPATRLNHLSLSNYRGFGSLELALHEKLTVIVATNGSGKTASLDAMAWCWSFLVDTLQGEVAMHGPLRGTDVRRSLAADGSMEAAGALVMRAAGLVDGAGFELGWEVTPSRRSSFGAIGSAADLIEAGSELTEKVRSFTAGQRTEAPLLPLISYYGTQRLWPGLSKPRKDVRPDETSRFSGYDDCLSSSSRYGIFVAWFERFARESQRDEHAAVPSPHKAGARLEAVRLAVDEVLRPTAWHHLEWDFVASTIVASHPTYGRLPVTQLSDGVRNMIGLVADLAHRAARLNPHLGAEAARQTPGVVLIDEVDLHLHPRWQQIVIGSLQRAFPEVQFIVTTHSPQVLSTVPNACIRAIELDGAEARVRTPGAQTKGVESATILAEVMGTDSIPDVEEARLLSAYRDAIEAGAGDSDEVRGQRQRLEAHFGKTHQVMLECERLRRIVEFKKNLPGDLGAPRGRKD